MHSQLKEKTRSIFLLYNYYKNESYELIYSEKIARLYKMITVDDNKCFVTSRGCEQRERPARVFYANVLASRWTSLTRRQEAGRITVCQEKLNANSGDL